MRCHGGMNLLRYAEELEPRELFAEHVEERIISERRAQEEDLVDLAIDLSDLAIQEHFSFHC